MMGLLTCPFCNEQDFDYTGLKQHILGCWCEADTFRNSRDHDDELIRKDKEVQP